METKRFSYNDGLLLTALFPDGKVNVNGWLNKIDYLDRWIMTFEEISESLERLQKSGLVTYDSGRFVFSECAKELCRGKDTAKRLSEYPYIVTCKVKYVLSHEEYDKAVGSTNKND